MQKHANLVDLVKSFSTNIFLQNLASIQKRTSLIKFDHLDEKSEQGSISNLSTKVLKPNAEAENHPTARPDAPRSSSGSPDRDDGVLEGSVKNWYSSGTCGFIVSPHVDGDIFCHVDDTEDRQPLTFGDIVTFRLSQDNEGRRCAKDVVLITSRLSDDHAFESEPALYRKRESPPRELD